MFNPSICVTRRTIRGFLFCIVACVIFLHVPYAYAACTVSTASVSFGSYDATSQNHLASNGSVTVDCSVGVAPPNPSVNVLIIIGQSPNSGSFNPRKMKNITGADLLNYNLYTNSSMTSIWGDGTGGTSTVTLGKVNRNALPIVTSVYGSIPAGQDVSAGSYSDILIVTITW
ncbi:Sigma-fimbria pilin [Candidatus Sulfobium mesophilum]|uniref:Sigma-fimbria pilin n=1 Tax=Candidatus Sulfobium mesophilum TaxID=2016548 RepID=A0A2U3QGS1_9BACT|nr:Sigma-fimbria pilin [Candidatus Sulfobium mesophilum]